MPCSLDDALGNTGTKEDVQQLLQKASPSQTVRNVLWLKMCTLLTAVLQWVSLVKSMCFARGKSSTVVTLFLLFCVFSFLMVMVRVFYYYLVFVCLTKSARYWKSRDPNIFVNFLSAVQNLFGYAAIVQLYLWCGFQRELHLPWFAPVRLLWSTILLGSLLW